MSSHHIVRDQQEPALILHRLNQLNTSILQDLLEWSPTVVCCEPALEQFIQMGHKVDVAVVDLKHLDIWKEKLAHQQPVKIVAINDQRYLETGLTILQRDQHKAANVITDDSSIDDVIYLLSDWCHLLDTVAISGTERYMFINQNFRKWVAAGSSFTVFTRNDRAVWTTTGFIDDVAENTASELNLYRKDDGEVEIKCSEVFIVAETI